MSSRLSSPLMIPWRTHKTQKSCYTQGYGLLKQNYVAKARGAWGQISEKPGMSCQVSSLSGGTQPHLTLPAMTSDNIDNICAVLTAREAHPNLGVCGLLVIGDL